MPALASAVDVPPQQRRAILSQSDDLLEEVELLRLSDREAVPGPLREAIEALQHRLGRPNPPVAPRTLKAAHDLIFAVQQRLMAANPKHATPRVHPGRGTGQYVTANVSQGERWKLLALPPLPVHGVDADWLQLVEDTVERACDRWAYAQHQAVRIARAKGPKSDASGALARARTAWENYWELRQEAAELRRRELRVLPGFEVPPRSAAASSSGFAASGAR